VMECYLIWTTRKARIARNAEISRSRGITTNKPLCDGRYVRAIEVDSRERVDG
jgi:hypothetical protein